MILLFVSALANSTEAQPLSGENQIIICLLTIDHADAGQLAPLLSPILSSRGTITAYTPTNTLIIKDRPEIVKKIVKVVKGHSDLSECGN